MSIFKDQSSRLLRTVWRSPQILAEELYAMFQSEEPVEFSQKATFKLSSGQSFKIEKSEQTAEELPVNSPPLYPGPQGSITSGDSYTIVNLPGFTPSQYPPGLPIPEPPDDGSVGANPILVPNPERSEERFIVEVPTLYRDPVHFERPPTVGDDRESIEDLIRRIIGEESGDTLAEDGSEGAFAVTYYGITEVDGPSPVQCRLYGPGKDGNEVVQVEIIVIKDGEVIPSGTPVVPIFLIGSTYKGQVAIWLE